MARDTALLLLAPFLTGVECKEESKALLLRTTVLGWLLLLAGLTWRTLVGLTGGLEDEVDDRLFALGGAGIGAGTLDGLGDVLSSAIASPASSGKFPLVSPLALRFASIQNVELEVMLVDREGKPDLHKHKFDNFMIINKVKKLTPPHVRRRQDPEALVLFGVAVDHEGAVGIARPEHINEWSVSLLLKYFVCERK